MNFFFFQKCLVWSLFVVPLVGCLSRKPTRLQESGSSGTVRRSSVSVDSPPSEPSFHPLVISWCLRLRCKPCSLPFLGEYGGMRSGADFLLHCEFTICRSHWPASCVSAKKAAPYDTIPPVICEMNLFSPSFVWSLICCSPPSLKVSIILQNLVGCYCKGRANAMNNAF